MRSSIGLSQPEIWIGGVDSMKQQATCAIEQTGRFDTPTTGAGCNALFACAVEIRPKNLQHEEAFFNLVSDQRSMGRLKASRVQQRAEHHAGAAALCGAVV
jgi:hypothetical protein